MRRSRSGLLQQPGSFWLGAGLVAELPAAVAISLLPQDVRETILQSVLTSWAGAGAAVAAVALLFLAVAWTGHRIGLGH